MRHRFWGLLLCLLTPAAVAATIEPFLGNFQGAAQIALDEALEQRDMGVEISRQGEGFRVRWITIIKKADGRIKDAEFDVSFTPTERAGIYSSAMRTNVFGQRQAMDPLRGDPVRLGQDRGQQLNDSLLVDQKRRRLRDPDP